MAAKILNPWGDRRDASVLDSMCCARRCLHIGEDKGAFTPGRGYTSYHKNPRLVCMSRHVRGCPHPLPEPDPEEVRCCRIPKFPKPRGRPSKQRCKSCGTWAAGWQLEMCRELPQLEHVECKHVRLRESDSDLFPNAWFCPGCRLRWVGKKPEAFEPGLTYGEFWDKRYPPRKESG